MNKGATVNKCPKCGGEMEEGMLPDRAESFVWKEHLRWAKGLNIAGLHAKEAKNVVSYRCKKCGYLENYAK